MLNLRVSSKKQAKIKLALQGCAGSGKTYSALLLAYGLCNDWTKIAIIDSEHGSADLYAHLGAYNVLSLSDNFTPETYMEAIGICEGAGMEVIIIDSISQCWDALLEYHAGLQGNSFTNWQKVTPRINAFMQKVLQSGSHVICTMRCKQDYVLSEKNGKMIPEKVRRKPYSIVLLDEIEKAHPDVFNLLLQVMDEGRLTDSYGRMVDFKNTVIIMTSNIGTRQLKEFGRGVGFATQSRLDDKEFSRSVIQKALNKSFAPEFINRVDEIITFDQLSLEAITKIIDIELKGLYNRIESIGYKLVIEDKAKQFVASKGYDVQYGARPLKRAIQTYLEDGLSELIISADLNEGDTITVSLNEEKGELEMKNEAKTAE